MGLKAHSGHGQQARLSWSLQHTRDDACRPLSNSPKQLVKAQWSMPVGPVRVGLQMLAIARHDTEFVRQGGHVIVHATALWRVGLLTDLQLGLYNLANRQYSERSDSGAGPGERQEGRMFRFSITRRFGS